MNLNGHVLLKPKGGGFVPSNYQQSALDWVESSVGQGKAAVMNAVAGSGKSRTLRLIYEKASSRFESILVVCFGKDAMLEAKQKNDENNQIPNVVFKTYHSYMNSAITKSYHPKLDLRGDKVEGIVKPLLASNHKFLLYPIKKLVSLCKGNAIPNPSDAQLFDAVLSYDIDFGDETPQDLIFKSFDLVRHALSESINMVSTLIDFDDMIYLPIVMNLTPDQYPAILADEFQDTNRAQAKGIQMGRSDMMLGVGDPWQSIFAFRGADSTAMQRLIEEFGADTLPLSICYRCPQVVGDLVRKEFPHIDFQTPEWAIPGTLGDMDVTKSLDLMQDGDLVVSRVNAALPSIAFALIRKGKTARIMGRDIGKTLEALIKKQNAYDLPELHRKLYDFRDRQMQKYVSANRPDKIQQLDDQIETIDALSEGANSVWDVVGRCTTMFSDERVGIQLGTIHKNKGREAKNVYIARPDLLPLPFVMKKGNAEARQQEMNMVYVSYTRAQENLTFLHGEL